MKRDHFCGGGNSLCILKPLQQHHGKTNGRHRTTGAVQALSVALSVSYYLGLILDSVPGVRRAEQSVAEGCMRDGNRKVHLGYAWNMYMFATLKGISDSYCCTVKCFTISGRCQPVVYILPAGIFGSKKMMS